MRKCQGTQLAFRSYVCIKTSTKILQAETHSSLGNKPPQDLPQASEKGLGLLGSWLGRNPQQAQTSSLLTVNTSATTATAELGTPTWSETSEASDFASVEASPAAQAASATTAFKDPQTLGQQSHARLAGRLGGWFTGVTSAAGKFRRSNSSCNCFCFNVTLG